jgi:hypothetical protein
MERAVLAGLHVEKVAWHDESSLSVVIHSADAVICMHAPLTSNVIPLLSRCRVIARYGIYSPSNSLARGGNDS